MALPSEVEDLPYLDEMKNPSLQQCCLLKSSTIEPKMMGKRAENGVSTPHVLSIRPYDHIMSKHAKKGLLVKTCHFTCLKVSCITKQVMSIDQTCLLTQTSNMYPNILEPMIYYNPIIKE